MSRKPHAPDDKTRAEVSALSSFGITQEAISTYLDLDAKTLRKYYKTELDNSRIKANAQVGKFLFKSASGSSLKDGATHGDCIRAAMFWMKTQAGWRENATEEPKEVVNNFVIHTTAERD